MAAIAPVTMVAAARGSRSGRKLPSRRPRGQDVDDLLMPVCLQRPHRGVDLGIAARALDHFGKHGEKLRIVLHRFAEVGHLMLQLLQRRQALAPPGLALGDEVVAHRLGDELDQRLLGRHVIVQRRDVDADAFGDVARAQSLEAALGDQRARRGGDRRRRTSEFSRARVGVSVFINQLIDCQRKRSQSWFGSYSTKLLVK